jgi:hypothetical protein
MPLRLSFAPAFEANVSARERYVRDQASATRASDTSSTPGVSRMPRSSRFQNASLLAIAVSANGRVSRKAWLAWRASQCVTPRSRATERAFSLPAIASTSVSAIGIDAVIPVVVATAPSTTKRRSAT